MGNSKDFSTLEDKIIICPKLDLNGEGEVITDTCNNVNAVEDIKCTSFVVPCPSGQKFFFRLSIPGEVFSLKSDGSGMMDCDALMDLADEDSSIIPIEIENGNAKEEFSDDIMKLSQLFTFKK